MTVTLRRPFPMTGCAAAALFIAACSTAQMPSAPSPQALEATPTSPSPPSVATAATARYRSHVSGHLERREPPSGLSFDCPFFALVGGTHKASARLWGEGLAASTGIKDMAERGRTTALDQEVEIAITAGTAEHLLGGGVGTSPGSVALEFEISQTHLLVTLVSMNAPSPDWFVGVPALPLFENGR